MSHAAPLYSRSILSLYDPPTESKSALIGQLTHAWPGPVTVSARSCFQPPLSFTSTMNIDINYTNVCNGVEWPRSHRIKKGEMTDETFRKEELLSAQTVGFTNKTFYMHKKLKFITNWMKEKSSRLFKLIATEIIVLCLHRAAAEI